MVETLGSAVDTLEAAETLWEQQGPPGSSMNPLEAAETPWK